MQDQTPELKWERKLKLTPGLIPSALEMRLIFNVLFQNTGSMITDGGYEDGMTVAAPQDGTVSFVQFNGRFGLTGLGRMYDKFGKSGEVLALNFYAAKKVMEGMGRKYGMQFYGFTTGTVAVVDTTATVTTASTVLLKQAYGSSLIGNTNGTASANQLTYLAQLFRGLDVIAPIHSGAVVTNGQGTVTAVTNATGAISVTTPGGSSTWTAGDPIVFWNSVIDATIAGTEVNLWPTGLLDITQSASLHGLATSTAPNWASYTDSSGGRFGFIKVRKGEQYINNYGGTEPDTLILSNGVLNDATDAERAAKRYTNTSMFDMDGNLEAEGIEIRTSLLAPPGMAFLYDSEVFTKLDLNDLPGDNASPDLFDFDKLPNQDQWAAAMNHVRLHVCTNRAGVAAFANLNVL